MESHILESLNAVGNLQSNNLKLDALEIDRKYPISDVKKIKTRYGEKTVVSLEGTGSVFLPDRFNKVMTDKYLSFMKKCHLIYRGKKDTGKAHPAYQVEFSPANDAQ